MRQRNSDSTLNPYIVRGDEILEKDRYGYKIIAVVHSKGFWSAYRGLTDWTDQRVAETGDKISRDVAEQLFPTLAYMQTYHE